MTVLTMSLLIMWQLRHIAHLYVLSFRHLYLIVSFIIESTPLVWLPAYQLFLFTVFCRWTPFYSNDTIAVYTLLLCREQHSQKDLSSKEQNVYCDVSLQFSLRHQAHLSYSWCSTANSTQLSLHKNRAADEPLPTCGGWHTHTHTRTEQTHMLVAFRQFSFEIRSSCNFP